MQCKYHLLQCAKLLMFSLAIKTGKCVQFKSSKRVSALLTVQLFTVMPPPYNWPAYEWRFRVCAFCDQIRLLLWVSPFRLADLHILYAIKQKSLPTDTFTGLTITAKFVCGRGSGGSAVSSPRSPSCMEEVDRGEGERMGGKEDRIGFILFLLMV